jgi:hypothetical protein
VVADVEVGVHRVVGDHVAISRPRFHAWTFTEMSVLQTFTATWVSPSSARPSRNRGNIRRLDWVR